MRSEEHHSRVAGRVFDAFDAALDDRLVHADDGFKEISLAGGVVKGADAGVAEAHPFTPTEQCPVPPCDAGP